MSSLTDSFGITLAEKDDRHRIYLCEHNLVHLDWGKHRLIYCPGDLMGLSYLFHSFFKEPCEMECASGDDCSLDHGDGMIHFPYGSFTVSLTVEECQHLHVAMQEAVQQLQH